MNVLELLWPVVAACVFFAAHVGLGHGVRKLAGIRDEPDIGLLGVWGLAASLVLGGVLNLAGLISLFSVRLLLALGLVLFVHLFLSRRKQENRITARALSGDRLLLVLFAVLAALVVFKLLLAGVTRFNQGDDFHAYLVFPVKMLQTGSLGLEPFSERSMMEYGGQSFLLALMLGLVPLKSLYAMDQGGAWLLFVFLVAGHGRKLRVDARAIVAILVILHVLKLPVANLSSVGTAMALMYGLWRSFTALLKERPVSRVVCMALLSAGLCTLKNSLVPPWGVLLTVLFLLAGSGGFRQRVAEYASVLALAAAMLAPWMIHKYLSSGTLFYPILGTGFHGSGFSDFPKAACGGFSAHFIKGAILFMVQSPMYVAGLLLALALPGFSRAAFKDQPVGKYVYCAAMVCAFLLLVAGDVYSERYLFPIVVPAIVFMVLAALGAGRKDPAEAGKSNNASAFLAVLVLGVLLGTNYYSFLYNTNLNARWLAYAKWDESVGQGDADLLAIQEAVPPGEPILARVSRPFDLDMDRNRILLIDWPGGASPPPGITVTGSAEELAESLRGQSIRYVMYSYGDEAGVSRERFSGILTKNAIGYKARESKVVEYTFLFQDRLLELAALYPKVADNGHVFVLDLSPGATQ